MTRSFWRRLKAWLRSLVPTDEQMATDEFEKREQALRDFHNRYEARKARNRGTA